MAKTPLRTITPSSDDLRTWIEIDKKAIAQNYRAMRKLVGKKVQLLGVVKSNAYGHDLIEWSKHLVLLGIDRLGVDSITEALALRRAGITTPVLVLGSTLPQRYEEARKSDIAVTVSSFPMLSAIARIPNSKYPLRVHIKIDTGMHRQGFQAHEREQLLNALREKGLRERIMIEGLYTHFAEAKNPRASDSARRQIAAIEAWRDAFLAEGYTPILHVGATGGTLLHPRAHYDMVRIGIGLYGLWPSKETERHMSREVSLTPALSWKARVSEVKDVKGGERIGYDLTELLARNTRLAIVPIGYWHGFPRLLSGRARVLIDGKTARVLGRVSMDMIAVDVTDIPKAKEGSVATIIGRDGKETIRASELADFAATSAYEILTRLNPLMMRIYR